MSNASKLAIVDKLLPLLEAFGASRMRQRELRKEMKASACTSDAAVVENGRVVLWPCYDSKRGRTPWCAACRQHDNAFAALMAERKANKKRLQKIESLAVAFAQPEPEDPPEPKELLDLMHKLEKEAVSAATDSVRQGYHEETHR